MGEGARPCAPQTAARDGRPPLPSAALELTSEAEMREAPADNIFGRILRGEIPSWEVYSDARCYAFLDAFPQAPGHSLVIPRRYSPNIAEVEPEDLAACCAAVQRLIPAIIAATGAKGITVMSNLGREAGQMVEYFHFHLIPRHPGDSVSLYQLGPAASPEEQAAMQARIRAAL